LFLRARLTPFSFQAGPRARASPLPLPARAHVSVDGMPLFGQRRLPAHAAVGPWSVGALPAGRGQTPRPPCATWCSRCLPATPPLKGHRRPSPPDFLSPRPCALFCSDAPPAASLASVPGRRTIPEATKIPPELPSTRTLPSRANPSAPSSRHRLDVSPPVPPCQAPPPLLV
jgi:hypothetical protein